MLKLQPLFIISFFALSLSANAAAQNAVIVNGKYRVTAALAGGQEKILTVVDFLIQKERAH